mmetsp:Transcript_21551/g.27196  ORF Transcript_21551/g.27196 Transcript_21551/m.27196 type:complete len:99 (+) Transcript_21551:1-297(+)
MHLTFNPNQHSISPTPRSSSLSATTTSENIVMTFGGLSNQNSSRGEQALSSKKYGHHGHKRNWKPRKHQSHDKANWTKQNNQSRSSGWRYGDKQERTM